MWKVTIFNYAGPLKVYCVSPQMAKTTQQTLMTIMLCFSLEGHDMNLVFGYHLVWYHVAQHYPVFLVFNPHKQTDFLPRLLPLISNHRLSRVAQKQVVLRSTIPAKPLFVPRLNKVEEGGYPSSIRTEFPFGTVNTIT